MAQTAQQRVSFGRTKRVLCSSLGLVYLWAFLAAYYQNGALVERADSLAPAWPHYSKKKHVSVLKLTRPRSQDAFELHVRSTIVAGLCLSVFATVGAHFSWVFGLLWLCYWTVVSTAEHSAFYAYGWESQLLETGFLAIFLCSPWSRFSMPSTLMLYLYRWLCFRISVGAGLIKIRGDGCWGEKSCLHFHFETQPMPSPLSFYFHFLPRRILSRGVDLDLLVQLYLAPLVLVPASLSIRLLRFAGLVQLLFMANIALSGNFSFLNVLTAVPALACLDDACFGSVSQQQQQQQHHQRAKANNDHAVTTVSRRFGVLSNYGLVATVAYLSRNVVANLLSPRQVMNTSFDPWRIVNTYGAFGDVGRKRFEAIVSLRTNETWFEIEFPCKPGDVNRRPCFSAPYHYRLDWNIWFLGFPPHKRMLARESWLYAMLHQLLSKGSEAAVLDLLDRNSVRALFLDRNAPFRSSLPLAAKVDMYHYRMAADLRTILLSYLHHHRSDSSEEERNSPPPVWWTRTFSEHLIPPLALDADNRLVQFATSPQPQASTRTRLPRLQPNKSDARII